MGNLHAKQQALKQRIKRRNSDPSAYLEKTGSIRRSSRLLRPSPVLPLLAMNARERAIVIESWQALNSKEPGLINAIISDAWLQSAERSPVWLWGLVGIDEAMQSDAAKNPKFQAIVNEVRQFLHMLIKTHHLDADAVRDQSYKLGVRHRNYMELGHQAAYWESFARCFSDSFIARAYEKKATSTADLCDDDLPSPSTTKPRRSFRQSFSRARLSKPNVLARQNSASAEMLSVVRNKRSKSLAPPGDSQRSRCSSIDGQPQIAHVADAWYKLMRNVVDSMRSGYTGEVGPVRLSLTSSILSLSSLRSGRSRPPTRQHSPRPSEGQIHDQNRSTTPLLRRRSIFRTPSPRNSLEININSLRRLSSPRNSLDPDSGDLNCFIAPYNYYADGRQDSVGSSGSNASSRGALQSSPARGPNVQSLAPYTARQCSLRRKPLVEALARSHFKVMSKSARDNDCA